MAPELDHQIAQAEATLAQLKATLQQTQANRELARVTWDRDNPLVQKGWVTHAAGHHRRADPSAEEAAVRVAQANVEAQEAQLKVLDQQKVYQSVVAPFDGVITQRNIDVGTLVQADATTGTFMFTLMKMTLSAPRSMCRRTRRSDCARRRSGGACAGIAGSDVSGHGDADRRCAAAGHANVADGDRRSQSRRRDAPASIAPSSSTSRARCRP